jgi:hypothetical protein
MTIQQALNELDKSEFDEFQTGVSMEWLAKEVGVGFYGYFTVYESDKVKKYPLKTWLCTDTMVGFNAYFLEETLVAVSYQFGRKYPIEMHWIDTEKYKMVLDHVIDVISKEQLDNEFTKFGVDMGTEMEGY